MSSRAASRCSPSSTTRWYSHVGESIYLDSNMGHAYVTADGCEEATVLGVCSGEDEDFVDSLMSLHGDVEAPSSAKAPGAGPTDREGQVRQALRERGVF